MKNIFKYQRIILFACLPVAIAGTPALADSSQGQTQDGTNYDTAGSENTHIGTVDSYGSMEINRHSPKTLILEGEEALRTGDLPTALSKAKRSLQLDNDDMEAHCLYANAITDELNAQSEKDPNLFNRCVEEWLSVMRNQFGEEKNMRVRGINPIGDLYHDEDRSIEAKSQLLRLTGTLPGTFETNNHYLKRVLRPSTSNVSAKVVSKKLPASSN